VLRPENPPRREKAQVALSGISKIKMQKAKVQIKIQKCHRRRRFRTFDL
jgi:hypothetical protein